MHPVYGPMVIGHDMLTFVQPVCKAVGPDGPSSELLSLPFPFANYFCDVPLWTTVQTWYDTSEKRTIDAQMEQLRQVPPEWIFYQRQPEVVRFHEQTFNGGQPHPPSLP